MAMYSIRLDGDTRAMLRRIRNFSEIDKQGINAALAEGVRESTLERFKQSKGPDGRRWKTSIRAAQEGGKTLIQSAQLRNSIHAKSDTSGFALGTGYRRIFTLKQRELTQTVAWLVDGVEALDRYGVDIPEDARILARRCWPGALTIVVKAAPCVPTFMRAADDTVALRASASPVVQALIRACGSPLACTSANTHGAPAPASFITVEGRILEGVDVAVDAGETPCRDASTIVSFQHGELQILRQGALPASEIERVLSDQMQ